MMPRWRVVLDEDAVDVFTVENNKHATHYSAFPTDRELSSLVLSNNTLLSTLDVQRLQQLSQLHIANTPYFNILSLTRLPNLRKLTVNQLTREQMAAFLNMPATKLQFLHINGCHMVADLSGLAKHSWISHLRITNQGLQTIPELPFNALEHLDLSFNEIDCSETLFLAGLIRIRSWMPKLCHLDLRYQKSARILPYSIISREFEGAADGNRLFGLTCHYLSMQGLQVDQFMAANEQSDVMQMVRAQIDVKRLRIEIIKAARARLQKALEHFSTYIITKRLARNEDATLQNRLRIALSNEHDGYI